MPAFSWVPGFLFLAFYLFVFWAVFYAIMIRVGEFFDFAGLFLKFYHFLKSLYHKEKY